MLGTCVGAWIERVRELFVRVRVSHVQEIGLLQAIHAHLGPAARRAFLDFRLTVPNPVPRLAPELEIAVFRIVQELVSNTVRHADARRLSVSSSRQKMTAGASTSRRSCGRRVKKEDGWACSGSPSGREPSEATRSS